MVAPLPDPVGPVAKTVRDGLYRRLAENWVGVMDDNEALRRGLSSVFCAGGRGLRGLWGRSESGVKGRWLDCRVFVEVLERRREG